MNYPTGTVGSVRGKAIGHLSPEQILDKVTYIFPEASEIDIKMLKSKVDSVIDKTEKNKLAYTIVKGDFDNSLELKKYLRENNFKLTPEREKLFYKWLHQFSLNKMSLVGCIDYIEHTFPLWTNLKKLLLDDRPGTGKKQWQYISENTSIPKSVIDNVRNAVNYKQLSNKDTMKLITYLVNNTIDDAQFEKTITQPAKGKGWFPFGIDKPPKQHSVKIKVLYKLAYSFGLSEDNMYKLCDGAVNYTSDPFDYEAVMLRFGLKNHISYEKCDEKIKYIEKQITVQIKSDDGTIKREKKGTTHYPLDTAIEELKKFFDKNIPTCNIQQTTDDLANYLCNICTSDSLEIKRREVASELMNNLINKTNVDNIQRYYSSIFFNVDDILNEKHYSRSIANKYISIINSEREKIKRLKGHNKIEALHLICDGKKVEKTGLGKGAFTEVKMANLTNQTEKVKRSDILRICYLDALIEYINGSISDDKINDYFENKSNRFLDECFFHPLHLSLPLDALMYLSLSIQDRCKPEVYQAFLERNLKNY